MEIARPRFWLECFNIILQNISRFLNECFTMRQVPSWLVEGRTTLVMKDNENSLVLEIIAP